MPNMLIVLLLDTQPSTRVSFLLKVTPYPILKKAAFCLYN